MTLAEYKNLFFKSDLLHVNNGGLSPISRPVHEEINHWSKRFFEDGFHSDEDYKIRMEWSRRQLATLVDCEFDEIAFFQSCAWGISQFAFGLSLKKDDEVILFDQEYASNLYPWQTACQRGQARLIILDSGAENEISISQIEKRITPHTKVIAVSSVQFQTGVMIDLEKLAHVCKEKNILLFVDVTQSLGIHPISMKKLNIAGLAGASHKWLNAPVGVGFLAVKKELAIQMNPIAIGATTYGECDDASDLACVPKHNAFKFEPGAKQTLEICALGKSAEIINQVKPEILREEAFRLAEILRSAVQKMSFKIHSPFIQSQFLNISPRSGRNRNLQKFLHDQGIRLPIRGPGVRITIHAFNTDAQIQKCIEILKQFKDD